MRFSIIEEADVILVSRGVYRQVKAYKRKHGDETLVYAKYGGGFVRLYNNHSTSCPTVNWDETDLAHKFNKNGRMMQ